jgi:hypothetical protein
MLPLWLAIDNFGIAVWHRQRLLIVLETAEVNGCLHMSHRLAVEACDSVVPYSGSVQSICHIWSKTDATNHRKSMAMPSRRLWKRTATKSGLFDDCSLVVGVADINGCLHMSHHRAVE